MIIAHRHLHRLPAAFGRRALRARPGLLVIVLGLSAAACDGGATDAPATPDLATASTAAVSTAVSDVVPSGDAGTPTATLPVSLTPSGPGSMADGAVVFYVDGAGLWRMDRTGARLLSPDARPETLLPSPDGRWVAFPELPGETRTESLRILSGVDGREAIRFAVQELRDALPDGRDARFPGQSIAQMDWAPVGDRFYFTTVGLRESGPPVRLNDLWAVDPEGDGPEELLPPGQGGLFSLSPDGSRIALTAAPGAGETLETLAIAAADGGDRRELASYPGLDVEGRQGISAEPAWETDGQSLLVPVFGPGTKLQDLPDADVEIRRFGLDGAVQTIVESDGYAIRIRAGYGLRLSPDSTRIAAALPGAGASEGATPAGTDRDPGRPARIVIAAIADLEREGWTGATTYDEGYSTFFEAWSPDGSAFTYSMQRSGEEGARGELHVGAENRDPRRIVADGRLTMPYWLSADQLLLLLDEAEPWLVTVDPDDTMTLLARLSPPADVETWRPVVGVATASGASPAPGP